MIPRLRPILGWPELRAALSPSSKDDNAAFEAAFAKTFQAEHAVSFPYGRVGLWALLSVLDIRDAEVICPAYTCVVVAHAIVFSGNRPVFVDASPDDYNMDLDQAEARITPQTKAIIATSLFGHPVDLDRLDALKARHPGVLIIQDCAHSFDARWHGRPVHKEGVAALFALNASKLLTSIFGGMITTDDADLAARLRRQRSAMLTPPTRIKGFARLLYLTALFPAFSNLGAGITTMLERAGVLDRFTKYFDPGAIDMPGDHRLGLTPLEARVGLAQLSRHEAILTARRSAAESWRRNLAGLPGLTFPPDDPGATYSHFTVLCDDPQKACDAWLNAGVQLGRILDHVIPLLPAYGQASDSLFPVSADLAKRMVNFPLAGVTDRQITEAVARYRRLAFR